MNLKNLKSLFINNGCYEIFVKSLSPNDNSKNQVYFGGSFEILNVLPISAITTDEAGDWSRERFKASIDFAWLSSIGEAYWCWRSLSVSSLRPSQSALPLSTPVTMSFEPLLRV